VPCAHSKDHDAYGGQWPASKARLQADLVFYDMKVDTPVPAVCPQPCERTST
jgi:hypothetical protein